MNAYEEYKTIIMAKSNTASAARARQEAVYGAVYGEISICTYDGKCDFGPVGSAVGYLPFTRLRRN